jgi:hypothetical protein
MQLHVIGRALDRHGEHRCRCDHHYGLGHAWDLPTAAGISRLSSGGMTIVPDTKDWTWVLRQPCPECGFDTRVVGGAEVADRLRANAAQWHDLLTGPAEVLRQRPSPQVWSPLEYACHVRDVFRVYDERVTLMLTQDDPYFPNWDQDATAVQERYAEQDPAVVREELLAAASQLADNFDSVDGPAWARPGRRSDGANFTVETIARYFIHDPVHHLYDATGRRPE